MFPQLECLGVVLAGPTLFSESVIVGAQYSVGHGKIRIELDGTLKVREGRAINFKVAAVLFSGSTFRNGDWFKETLSAVLSVSSNTASPVLLAKSARVTVSFSVRRLLR